MNPTPSNVDYRRRNARVVTTSTMIGAAAAGIIFFKQYVLETENKRVFVRRRTMIGAADIILFLNVYSRNGEYRSFRIQTFLFG